MRKNLTFFLFFAVLFLMNNTTSFAQKGGIDAKFDAFKQKFILDLWKQYPEWGVSQGYYKYASMLSIPDDESRFAALTFNKKSAEAMAKFDVKALSPNNQCDFKMLDNYFKKTVWELSTFKEYEWNPASFNVADAFNELLIKPYKPLKERLKDIMKKMEHVPDFYFAAKANYKRPTKEHTQLAIAQHAGTLEVLKMVKDSLEATKTFNPKHEKTILRAQDAVNDYIIYLQTRLERKNAPWKNFAIGKGLFAKKFEFEIVSDYNAQKIYEKANAHKAKLHAEMIRLTKEIWKTHLDTLSQPKDSLLMVKMMIDKLSEKHTKPEDFVNTIRAQIPDLTRFVADKNLLELDPTKPLEVRETPIFMRGTAGASISSPGPYEKKGTTFYNVDPMSVADGWTPEKAESYLREYNDYILQILNIHEAIPGHYAQLVYSNKNPSIIKSVFGNGAMIEGWAVYTERMMLEEGYGDNTPEMWLMYYKWNLRSACNTIIDYGMQCNNMQKTQVLDLLQNQAFQTQAEAEGKYRRATLSQVQLCSYFTGFSEIYDFRNAQKAAQKDKFDLKKFHETFLSFGSAPVKYVKELMKQ
jgi:uncharacterized protein (DUF885 family)